MILIRWWISVVCLMMLEGLRLITKRLRMRRREMVMDLGSRTTRIKERRKNLVEALSRMLLR